MAPPHKAIYYRIPIYPVVFANYMLTRTVFTRSAIAIIFSTSIRALVLYEPSHMVDGRPYRLKRARGFVT